jgi:hypothetical protein
MLGEGGRPVSAGTAAGQQEGNRARGSSDSGCAGGMAAAKAAAATTAAAAAPPTAPLRPLAGWLAAGRRARPGPPGVPPRPHAPAVSQQAVSQPGPAPQPAPAVASGQWSASRRHPVVSHTITPPLECLGQQLPKIKCSLLCFVEADKHLAHSRWHKDGFQDICCAVYSCHVVT